MDLDPESRRLLLEQDVEVVVVSDVPAALVLACRRRAVVAVVEDALAGEQLAAAVRALVHGAGVPVLVAVSGSAGPQVLDALDAGARGLVGLPVVGSELCRALAELRVASRESCLVVDDVVLRPRAAELQLGGQLLTLGRQSLALAQALLSVYPSAASKDQLSEALGNPGAPASAETLKRAVARLRRQIAQVATDPRYGIEAVRGCGYRWVVRHA